MDWTEVLEHSFVMASGDECPPGSRLDFLGDYVFDFTTYDGEMSELFALKAVEVAEAINDGKTFDYIRDPENYRWYLMMCNYPFFAERIEWGTSIRGAWWQLGGITFTVPMLFIGENQVIDPIRFTREEWQQFIAAIVSFARTPDTGDGHE